MNPFKLEVYLGKYEFSAPYLLCCSDAESMSMREILQMASPDDKHMWDNLNLGYTEVSGLPALRKQIAESLYPSLSKENIICFAGAEDGIFCALNILCEKEDHVIVITPCYQSLIEIPRSKGCEISEIKLKEENSWKLNIEELKQAIKTNTKCMIINFPHNPTGQIISQPELEKLTNLLNEHGIWLFSDEVYRLLGNPKTPWTKPAVEIYDKAISLGVMSKAMGLAGLRVGWLACQNREFITKLEQMKHYTSICNSGPSEILSLIALKNLSKIMKRNNQIVSENLSMLDLFFSEHYQKFSWTRPEGGCVGLVKYNSDESADDFCDKLVKAEGVLLLPGSVYDLEENYFRIGFGRKNMPQALGKLAKFLR